jgi:hypothetical protein
MVSSGAAEAACPPKQSGFWKQSELTGVVFRFSGGARMRLTSRRVFSRTINGFFEHLKQVDNGGQWRCGCLKDQIITIDPYRDIGSARSV